MNIVTQSHDWSGVSSYRLYTAPIINYICMVYTKAIKAHSTELVISDTRNVLYFINWSHYVAHALLGEYAICTNGEVNRKGCRSRPTYPGCSFILGKFGAELLLICVYFCYSTCEFPKDNVCNSRDYTYMTLHN